MEKDRLLLRTNIFCLSFILSLMVFRFYVMYMKTAQLLLKTLFCSSAYSCQSSTFFPVHNFQFLYNAQENQPVCFSKRFSLRQPAPVSLPLFFPIHNFQFYIMHRKPAHPLPRTVIFSSASPPRSVFHSDFQNSVSKCSRKAYENQPGGGKMSWLPVASEECLEALSILPQKPGGEAAAAPVAASRRPGRIGAASRPVPQP